MLKKLSMEQKNGLTENIQEYFKNELGMSLGNLAVENLIEFMLLNLGPLVYNEALNDARAVVNERVLSLEDELYSLEKQIKL